MPTTEEQQKKAEADKRKAEAALDEHIGEKKARDGMDDLEQQARFEAWRGGSIGRDLGEVAETVPHVLPPMSMDELNETVEKLTFGKVSPARMRESVAEAGREWREGGAASAPTMAAAGAVSLESQARRALGKLEVMKMTQRRGAGINTPAGVDFIYDTPEKVAAEIARLEEQLAAIRRLPGGDKILAEQGAVLAARGVRVGGIPGATAGTESHGMSMGGGAYDWLPYEERPSSSQTMEAWRALSPEEQAQAQRAFFARKQAQNALARLPKGSPESLAADEVLLDGGTYEDALAAAQQRMRGPRVSGPESRTGMQPGEIAAQFAEIEKDLREIRANSKLRNPGLSPEGTAAAIARDAQATARWTGDTVDMYERLGNPVAAEGARRSAAADVGEYARRMSGEPVPSPGTPAPAVQPETPSDALGRSALEADMLAGEQALARKFDALTAGGKGKDFVARLKKTPAFEHYASMMPEREALIAAWSDSLAGKSTIDPLLYDAAVGAQARAGGLRPGRSNIDAYYAAQRGFSPLNAGLAEGIAAPFLLSALGVQQIGKTTELGNQLAALAAYPRQGYPEGRPLRVNDLAPDAREALAADPATRQVLYQQGILSTELYEATEPKDTDE
jgi:hypothetical protein